ncbi:YlbL family protein [Arthrobacter castelli]|uniref:YlbL family protein n=1 Tax=Arthrobacter castelli TaxID=271431 RepID=UPI0009D7896D|nr:S16 family serine protease [Arthrobacter castelli]
MVVSGVIAVVLIVAALFLPAPYVVESPGPTFNTLGKTEQGPVIEIEEHQSYPAGGHLNLTTVYVTGGPGPRNNVSIFQAFEAWADQSDSVLPVELVYPPDVTRDQIQQQNAAAMDSSQDSAIAAAMTQLGIEYNQEMFVVGFTRDSAAKGVLQKDDIPLRINGKKIENIDTLRKELNASGGKTVQLTIKRDGETITEEVTPNQADSGDYRLGVFLGTNYDFPFKVDIGLQNVGGPSAGMMFALGIMDKLTEGKMTGGRFFAGTGTISSTGDVGPIGGIQQKMVGADKDGAEVFLAPAGNCSDVEGNVPQGMDVYSVETLDDAVDVVKTVGSGGDTSALETCQSQ